MQYASCRPRLLNPTNGKSHLSEESIHVNGDLDGARSVVLSLSRLGLDTRVLLSLDDFLFLDSAGS